MSLRRALLMAGVVVLFAGGAKAQFGPAMPQQEPPCVKEFSRLRDDAEKKASAIRAAGERKAQPREACQLFNAFVAAQSKMVKYATDNSVWCGIPNQVLANLNDRTSEFTQEVVPLLQALRHKLAALEATAS